MNKLLLSTFVLSLFVVNSHIQASEDEVKAIDNAWAEVESRIHSMGETVRELSSNPRQRYDGYKAVMSILTDQYVNQIYADRNRPETLPLIDLTNNCAPGGDFKYSTIQIEEAASYHVWGNRGKAQLIDFQQMPVWIRTKDDKRETVSMSNTTLKSQNIKVDAQGNFDFIMSDKDPGQDQWFKLDQGATVVLIREMFSDYKTQNESAVFHIERIGFEDTGTTVPSPVEAAKRIDLVAQAMDSFKFCITMPRTTMPAEEDNIMRELHFKKSGEQVNQRYITTRFNIQPGQALIGEWAVPKGCAYWNMTLYTDFWQTMNSFNRQVTLNHAIAKPDGDGVVRFVLSHVDPGVANWLDVDGYQQGVFIARGKHCPGTELISSQVVPVGQIKQHLPKDTQWVTAEQRAENLEIRREHFQSIFRR